MTELGQLAPSKKKKSRKPKKKADALQVAETCAQNREEFQQQSTAMIDLTEESRTDDNGQLIELQKELSHAKKINKDLYDFVVKSVLERKERKRRKRKGGEKVVETEKPSTVD